MLAALFIFMKTYRIRIIPKQFAKNNILDYYENVTEVHFAKGKDKGKAISNFMKEFPINSRPIIYSIEVI